MFMIFRKTELHTCIGGVEGANLLSLSKLAETDMQINYSKFHSYIFFSFSANLVQLGIKMATSCHHFVRNNVFDHPL